MKVLMILITHLAFFKKVRDDNNRKIKKNHNGYKSNLNKIKKKSNEQK